jgi:hypothetical protein
VKWAEIKRNFLSLAQINFLNMKKAIIIFTLLIASFVNAQAFKGKGDIKFQVGANLQNRASGITITTDFGLGENMSYGFYATYLLSADKIAGVQPKFEDRADFKARFNANIGNVLNFDEKLDIYPGLDLGLRNFGTHLGARYFFTNGFGVYAEAGFPIAKYDSNVNGFEHYNNQFTAHLGMSFNL